MYNTVSHTMLDQTLASWLEHDSEFPELLVLESKLEWIFKDALDSVSGFPRRPRATGLRKGRHNFFLFCINVPREI